MTGKPPSETPPAQTLLADSGRPFEEPWQARVFALAHHLVARDIFTWPEHADALSAAIRRAQAAGDPDRGDTYWQHYLAALEDLVQRKRLA
ncbi:nitrile hydratase accessory protein [Algihabitans albus]|uniref:nitrile hydratase accessory protein n=1 Tax=Algihabitans albus TaxID=2164067 RepID=UPI000E5D3FF3|nr:nitrile hydratase accessory protein [Algihabitans albus]